MRIFSHLLRHVVAITGMLLLVSASQHTNTSVNPISQRIHLDIGDERITVHLDGPGVYYEKRRNGSLEHLQFQRLDSLVKIWFHRKLDGDISEPIRLLKRFQLVDGKWLAHGPMQSFDHIGELLSETNWVRGLMHGKQLRRSKYHVLLEEKEYDHGFPIGTWRQYYEDGTLASEVTYPKSRSIWLSTMEAGSNGDETSLLALDYYNPTTALEVWYSEEGVKQKEMELLFLFDGYEPHIIESGRQTFFDRFGRVVRHTEAGEDKVRTLALGVEYTDTKVHKGKHFFKREKRELPSTY